MLTLYLLLITKVIYYRYMFIKLYAIALPVFFVIDMTWLGLIANNFYKSQIGTLMKSDINWTAAILFYVLFIVGLVVFAISPAVDRSSWSQAIMLGALFGFISYATYDLTNLSTLKNWPIMITVVDMMWGAMLGALVSVVTYFISVKVGL